MEEQGSLLPSFPCGNKGATTAASFNLPPAWRRSDGVGVGGTEDATKRGDRRAGGHTGAGGVARWTSSSDGGWSDFTPCDQGTPHSCKVNRVPLLFCSWPFQQSCLSSVHSRNDIKWMHMYRSP
jgi:hypothetical protein